MSLEWKTGVSATNWDEVAKKENLDLMATELRKLEDSVKEVHNEMLYLRRREEQMRNLNGARTLCKSAALPIWDAEVPKLRAGSVVRAHVVTESHVAVPASRPLKPRGPFGAWSCSHQVRRFAESTNERVALFSIASLVIVVGLGAWQLWYLRSFFHRKKLL